jgi:hypothetical protein
MKMSLYKSLSLQQTAELIAAVGDVQTILAQGEMGIGKSSILKMLKDNPKFKKHRFCYVDITTKDVGDFVVPKIRTVDGVDVCSFIPNEEFGMHFVDQPVVMMLDELGKAKGGVMNACLRLMQERSLGTYNLHPDSIVFATTNLAVEGIGDLVPPHARNRVTQVRVAKPNAEELMTHFINKGVNPIVVATIREYPEMLASFEDYESPQQNMYINDPRDVRLAVVTPRSLEKAGYIVDRCAPLGKDILAHALKGTVGDKAMLNMLTMIDMDSQLADWDDIIKSPQTVAVPNNGAASCMLIAKAVQRIRKDSINAWMDFLPRMSKEAQGLFARSVMQDKCPTREVAATNPKFAKWAADNNYMFARR